MDIYKELGITSVINASGRMTKLGVSCISDEVKQAMDAAASHYVVMDELMEAAGRKLAHYIGCEDVCVTSSASSGIALAIASLICGNDLQSVQQFHKTVLRTDKREVVLLKGHNVDFGAPIDLMIHTGGGIAVETGYANASCLEDIRHAVNAQTLAILYVKSHHCVQKNMVDAAQVIALAKQLQLPCIIDAAAEEELSRYIRLGADFVCYSGAKAIPGPTSGFVACRKKADASAMRLQYRGIGRVMKVGKEHIAGLVKAVELYTENGGYRPVINREELQSFCDHVAEIPGLKAALIHDEAGRDIIRCRIQVLDEYGCSAAELASYMKTCETPVYTRDYRVLEGFLDIDPRPLNNSMELQTIWQVLHTGKGHVL